jgi:hypothetical protein
MDEEKMPRTDKEFERLKAIPNGNYNTEEALRLIIAGMYRFSGMLEKELDEIQKQRDNLATAANRYTIEHAKRGAVTTKTIEQLEKALAAVKGGAK